MPAAERKTVCLGMPSHGELTAGAARGFYLASREHNVRLRHQEGSLLACNFNVLWCWALNEARTGGCDYFAMQHADIEPTTPHWLDALVAELESRDLDVLGVAVPIKDGRGLTSTAIAHPSGSTWRVHGRLSTREVHRLPPTFTAADVGRPLLLNTGLWVCRFREEWARRVHFTINDRIVWDPARGAYRPEVEPEDWFFSRLLHEQGLKIGCTRKVAAEHRGPMNFSNAHPWGSSEFDAEAGLAASVLDEGRDAGDWFPHDAAGWLTEAEGRELARLAEGKAVIELGSYCGRSTVCLARTARGVTAVDTFDGRGTPMPGDTLPTFLANIERHRVADRVTVCRGEAASLLPSLPPVFELAFVDAAHDYESVRRDAGLAARVLRPGGLLAFHDYGARDPGVTAAVDELLAGGAELLARVDTLAVVRPAPAGAAAAA